MQIRATEEEEEEEEEEGEEEFKEGILMLQMDVGANRERDIGHAWGIQIQPEANPIKSNNNLGP